MSDTKPKTNTSSSSSSSASRRGRRTGRGGGRGRRGGRGRGGRSNRGRRRNRSRGRGGEKSKDERHTNEHRNRRHNRGSSQSRSSDRHASSAVEAGDGGRDASQRRRRTRRGRSRGRAKNNDGSTTVLPSSLPSNADAPNASVEPSASAASVAPGTANGGASNADVDALLQVFKNGDKELQERIKKAMGIADASSPAVVPQMRGNVAPPPVQQRKDVYAAFSNAAYAPPTIGSGASHLPQQHHATGTGVNSGRWTAPVVNASNGAYTNAVPYNFNRTGGGQSYLGGFNSSSRYSSSAPVYRPYGNALPGSTTSILKAAPSPSQDFSGYTTRSLKGEGAKDADATALDEKVVKKEDPVDATASASNVNSDDASAQDKSKLQTTKTKKKKKKSAWGASTATSWGGSGDAAADSSKTSAAKTDKDEEDTWWSKSGATASRSAVDDERSSTFRTASDRQSQRVLRDGASAHERDKFEKRLFAGMDKGINFDKYEDIPVEVSGRDPPEGIDSFDDVKLPRSLLRNIERAKFTKPTPVQKYSLPAALANRDVMACAQTGSGKTAGFLFPIICRIEMTQRPRANNYEGQGRFARRRASARPRALIIAPTRELASQIFDEATKFSYQTKCRPVVVYGGAHIGQQIRQLQRGCDLLVATPGRVADLLERRCISLADCFNLCLDEADRMLDMGFEPQIRQIVHGFDMPRKGERQTLMFSATFPTEIQKLASDFLDDYVFLTVGRVGSTTDNITQHIEYVDEREKTDKLLELLVKVPGLTLVFVETRRSADMLENILRDAGIPATSIHGDRDQREREEALHMFRTGASPIMVATDVAARGLDIPNVKHVINYDMPKEIDSYVHRIGRTGRAGNTGTATAFMNEGNKNLVNELYTLLSESGQHVPKWFESYASSASAGRRGGGGFGGRDFRSKHRSKKKSGGSRGARRDARSTRRGGGGAFSRGGGYTRGGNSGSREDNW